MYQYVYFAGAMIVFPLWLLIVLKRRDLFFQMIIIGAFTAVSALFFEFFWFFKDYWRPLEYVSVSNFVWQETLFCPAYRWHSGRSPEIDIEYQIDRR
jgi:hypothetical protein